MKSNLDKIFQANKSCEEEGIWFEVAEGTKFRVLRFNENNPALKAAMAKFFKPYAHAMQLGTLDPRKEREIMTKVFVNTSLVDWKGVDIDDQHDVPFSKEKATELLIRLPELFSSLIKHAQDFQNFKEEYVSPEALGNFSNPTSGGS